MHGGAAVKSGLHPGFDGAKQVGCIFRVILVGYAGAALFFCPGGARPGAGRGNTSPQVRPKSANSLTLLVLLLTLMRLYSNALLLRKDI